MGKKNTTGCDGDYGIHNYITYHTVKAEALKALRNGEDPDLDEIIGLSCSGLATVVSDFFKNQCHAMQEGVVDAYLVMGSPPPSAIKKAVERNLR